MMLASELLSDSDVHRLHFRELTTDLLAIAIATAALLLVIFLGVKLAAAITQHLQMRLLAGLATTLAVLCGAAVYWGAFVALDSEFNYRVGASMLPGEQHVPERINADVKRITSDRARHLFVEPDSYGARTPIAWLTPLLAAGALLSICHVKANRVPPN